MTDTSTETTRVLLAPEDLIGFEINGQYSLNSLIGEGGMGVVYLTEQRSIGREAALKLIKPGGLQGTKRLDRFVRETAIISRLTHPNIVRVFDSGVADELGLHFIVMELVRGISLDVILKTHRLKTELALEIIYQICGALSEPHKENIIHRDIKPENTLVTAMADETVQVKVLDFGIARSHEGDGRITTTGVVMGTPRYMAPETVQGGKIDARTDLYALGIMLFEMIVGRSPFWGATPMATMIKHVTEVAPTIATEIHDFPYPEIGDLVAALLAKDPEDRPESAPAVRKTIDEIRDKYGFGRVRVDPNAKPIDALDDWLIERGDTYDDLPRSLYTSDSWDDAGSYDHTMPVDDGNSQEGRSADNLIPVPVEAARKHLESKGRSLGDAPVPVDETLDFDAETAEYVSDEHKPLSPRQTDTIEPPVIELQKSGPPVVPIVVVVALIAVVIAVIATSKDERKTVQMNPSESTAAVKSPVTKIDTPVVANAPDLATADAGDDMSESAVADKPDLGNEPAAEPVKTDPKPTKKPPKPAKDPQKPDEPETEPADDEFKKGMEWLKQR